MNAGNTVATKRNTALISSSRTRLQMSNSGGGGKGSTVTALVLAGIIAVYVVSGVAPMLQMVSAPNAIDNTMSLGDAVATRTDNAKYQATQKQLQEKADSSVVAQYEKLSRTKIQEKLNRVPVFYLADSGGDMAQQIYISYGDAQQAAEANKDKLYTVECTTLDEVM
jgi:hypothetical protein